MSLTNKYEMRCVNEGQSQGIYTHIPIYVFMKKKNEINLHILDDKRCGGSPNF